MGTGFFLLRMRIRIQMRIESQLRSLYCALPLPYDSTNYVGPVFPLLTLVVLPEAGFTLLREYMVCTKGLSS
jgi:hypothetical protein